MDVRRRQPARRLPHADQDAHPRRRRALGQAAGRPHRSRRRARRCRTRIGGRSSRGWCRRCARRRRAARLRLRHRPRDARRRRARAAAGSPRRSGARPPVLVDSRYALLGFRGMTACTPNESEVEQLLGDPDRRERSRCSRRRAASCWRARAATPCSITRGSRGMALFERGSADRSTSRSSGRIRSPTSPAPAIRSSPR